MDLGFIFLLILIWAVWPRPPKPVPIEPEVYPPCDCDLCRRLAETTKVVNSELP